MSDLQGILDVICSYSLAETEWVQVQKLIEQEFDERHKNRELYLASDGIQPVGIYQLILGDADNGRDLADGTSVAHVHHLRVLKERRRQGLGRHLMLHAECEARDLGRQRLTVGVDSWNDEAIAFYRALGYAQFKEAAGLTADQKLLYLCKEI